MTNDEIRIAVAESMGWGDIKRCGKSSMQPSDTGAQLRGTKDDITSSERTYYFLPNYPLDLNACAEFEKTLEPFEWSDYTMAIRRIIQRDCNKPECYVPGSDRSQLIADFWFYHATALQRCEAFLRTRGLWVEGGAE